MKSFSLRILVVLFLGSARLSSQESAFTSFVQHIHQQYEIDIALAPELIPTLDSLRLYGPDITNLEDLLHMLVHEEDVSYRIIDGNKLLLRKDIDGPGVGHVVVRGRVINKLNGRPISFAAVSYSASNIGTYTDEEGWFELHLPAENGYVHIYYLGYTSLTFPVKDLLGQNPQIEMEVSSTPLEQVVIIVPYMPIESNNQSLNLRGYQFISNEDLKAWNADRLINTLTGYTHFSSEQGIRIRGSAAENALVVMDGIPVYDPYHFYNIFSPFNGHYFSTVNVYKNNLPIEYGGRIDGMIEARSETQNQKGSSLLLDTDLLLSTIAAEVKFSDQLRLKAGGRISHTEILNEALSDSSSANFTGPGIFKAENEWSSTQKPTSNFYDINLGLDASIDSLISINAAYFKNKDYLDNTITNELETSTQFIELIQVDQTIRSRDEWLNEGAALQTEIKLGHLTSIGVNTYLSRYEKSITYTSLLKEKRQSMVRTSINNGYQTSILQSFGGNAFIRKESKSGSVLTAGVDFQHHDVDLVALENSQPYLLQVQSENESTLFGKYDIAFPSGVNLGIGSRLTHLNSTDRVYIQPSIDLNYNLTDDIHIKSSFSKNIQAVRELSVENRFGREIEFLALSSLQTGYPVLKSDKYMVGAGYITDGFSLDAELFYKNTDGLISVRAPRPDPSFENGGAASDFYRLFLGEGETAGLDLIATQKSKQFSTTLNYTLSKITQQFDMLFNGEEFSPKEDRRHQIKWSSQYYLGDFTITGLLNYKTKAPYVSFVRLEGRDGIGMVDQAMVIRYLPVYFSLDLGVDYAFHIIGQPAVVGFSVINITNHENINDLQHVGRISREGTPTGSLFLTQETELLGRTFNVHFRYLLN